MKQLNILLIALVAIVLCGCRYDTTTEKHRIDDVVGTINKFEFEGHTYLIRTHGGVSLGYGGICHDENCKCKTDSIK